MKRAQAQRADAKAGQSLPRERLFKLEQGLHVPRSSHRRHHADLFLDQATKGYLEHARGRSVEPLDVIERDDHRPLLGESPKGVEHREPDRPWIRSPLSRLGH